MKKQLLPLSLVVFLSVSCNKKNDPAPSLSLEQIITNAKGWVLSAATINPPIQVQGLPPISDFLLAIEDCDKDDVTFFLVGGQFKIDEGATKCDESGAQVKLEGTWEFNSNKTAIPVAPGSEDTYTMTISELNATTLKVSEPFDFGTGTTYTVTLTYSAIK
ncbi:MAG: hypothetical protein ACKOE6_11065 [Flammeovirgaceae bacterium]